ncbi:MAG: DUF4007 family protein [Prolixibacteraceae bacterium]|jgi:hypothetical protein|nr:DUF4007 family protein [Prolixibacteraceae bacterium]MBT6004174.1 DUF4007 family protein [Prolixibacteraceae bacterium]MBT6763692.1 DUF4007 family protein [Prolixibacteraceae bacterium]MBT7000999.1 DUF4007 family protein [Prolixibacteraceae bacterium]MBT7393713.1 DUF4007 family protein [Prolixibacteraceae bacterium]
MSLRFTGHETFVVRTFWPKKGYDFIKKGGTFSAENAVVDLGVGKNMVASIQFWMKALGLFNDGKKELTEIAHFLFGEHGVDPYLEDIGSVWLLHYHLVRSNYSSIYNLVFNDLRKERAVFKKQQLVSFIKRKYSENSDNYYNPNTIDKDISIFTRLYKKVDYKSISKNFEDEISGLMLELELISSSIEEEVKEGTNKKEKVEWFYLHGENRNNFPAPILLFSILDNFEGDSNIAVRRLQIEANSPNMVFLLSKDALYNKLKELENLVSGITISETAGNVILVLPEGLDKWKILRDYYAN